MCFCRSYNISSPFPVSELILCYFVVDLARQGLTPTTIKTYLAAIRHAQIVRGLPELRQAGLPRLQLVQSGIRRERARQGTQRPTRLPITPDILHRIRRVWLTPPLQVDHVMMWAASATCFFGFFRAGEITVPTATEFDNAVHLAWGDVSVNSVTPPSMVRVFLKRSKTDQFGQGVEVFLGATGDELCPVATVVSYSSRRGSASGPFFKFKNGSPLTKARFVDGVRSALSKAGVRSEGYTGHSFRIGAATSAARAGVQDSVIQALGRWSSSAFLRYIRTPREDLAAHSKKLSRDRR